MIFLLIAVLLVGATQAQQCLVELNTIPFTVHMDEEHLVPFSITCSENMRFDKMHLNLTTSDYKVAEGTVPKYTNSEIDGQKQWNDNLTIRGLFIGSAEISLQVHTEEDTFFSNELLVTVIRAERMVDHLFTASVATLVSILYINFGCAMDWSVCRNTLRKPVGPAIGAFCQFLIMPLIAYALGHFLFPDRPEMQIGIFFTGISPSGGASNIWTVLLGGNLNLSVTMTTLGTLASFATMPIWIFTLGKRIFDKGNLTVPYDKVGYIAIGLIIPLSLGYLIQKKFPRLCRVMVRIMKPFSVILILFIIVFAIITNLYLFKLFSWQIVVAGMGLAWLGFICGYLVMRIFRQPTGDVRAIAIETGIQNTGIAIFLLRFSLTQPAADLTTVIPVSCAIMTPIPLTVLWLIKLVLDGRQKKKAASRENLREDEEHVNTITT